MVRKRIVELVLAISIVLMFLLPASMPAQVKTSNNAHSIPKLKSNPSYDLLIIAPEIFNATLTSLVNHKNNLGIKTILINLEAIPDYLEGRDLQEDIKLFIKYAKETWDIRYVILGGDNDSIPARYATWDYIPSDLYYADLYWPNGSFCSWDSNNNSLFAEWNVTEARYAEVDGRPDVCLGRLPADTINETEILVNKIIDYETDVDDRAWFTRFILLGGDTEDECDYIYTNYMSGFNATKLYESIGNLNPTNVIAAINNGAGFLHYSGHGGHDGIMTYGVGDPEGVDVLYNEDIEYLNNSDALPIITLTACWTCDFDYEDCFGERLLLHPNGGSIATLGSTVPHSANHEHEFFYRAYYNGTHTLGEILAQAQQDYVNEVWGRANETTFILINHFPWVLLGDPTLNISAPPLLPNIKLTSPTAGDILTGNTTHNITWTYSNVTPENARVWLKYTSGWYSYPIIGPISPESLFSWLVPKIDFTTVQINATIENILTGKKAYSLSGEFAIDYTAPTISSIAPTPDELGVSQSPEIKITFNEPMNYTSVEEAFSLQTDGSEVPCSLQNISFYYWTGYTVEFKPTDPLLPDTWYWVNITTKAKDCSKPGNALESIYTWKFKTRIEIENPPAIEAATPVGTNVPINANIVIRFSMSMSKVSVEDAISINPNITYTHVWSDEDTKLTINPNVNLANFTTYTVKVRAWVAKDTVGNYFVQDYNWSFTTGTSVDIEAPNVKHIPISSWTTGKAITINATVTDNLEVESVKLYYRNTGDITWTVLSMSKNIGNVYTATIPSSAVTTAGIQYYIEANDTIPNTAVIPSTAPGIPYSITIKEKEEKKAEQKGFIPGFETFLILIVLTGYATVGIKRRKKAQPPEKPA